MFFRRRRASRPLRRTTLKRRVFFLILVISALAFFAGAAGIAAALLNLPDPEYLFSRRVIQSTKIFDASGKVLLFEIHGEEKRTVVPFSEMPAAAKNAAVAIEDANFYQHRGVDFRGIVRAFLKDIASRDFSQGGSTITQQLIKNSLLGRERTITRKIKEAALAVLLESKLGKDEILAMYLNQIPYGQNAYGLEAAAETYFGKHAKELSVAESALLAALPRAPSYYSPYGQHRDELFQRKNLAIDRMRELGYLSAGEAGAATSETLKFLPAAKDIRAPHFVMFVREYLNNRYGEAAVEESGLVVTTTLDWRLQEEAEKLVGEYAEKNKKLIQAKNMALAAVNPRNGNILAMVGSPDYFDLDNDGNYNTALALRQPGSSFKPFVYATAFKKGFTPNTVLFDLPTEFNPKCDPDGRPRPGATIDPKDCYHPQNYDDRFRGPVTLRQAIAQSLNVPSVKLLYLAGIEDSIRTAEDMGITTLSDRERFGLSLVLGGGEVRLLEMASAFGVFANDGALNPPAAVLKVETNDGKILEEKIESPRQVLDSEVARLINDVLSDNEARVPVFARESPLYFPTRQVAVKTGTTQEYRDAWTIGYTPNIAAGVWAGNNDNAPMRQKGSGVLAASPTWRAFMDFALAAFPPEEFPKPTPPEAVKPALAGIWQGDTIVVVDAISRKLATEHTPPETRKEIAYGQPHDLLYWIDPADPTGPPPQNPEDNPQYPNWEKTFQDWLPSSGFVPQAAELAPQEYDDVHTPEKKPRIIARHMEINQGIAIVRLKIESAFAIKEVTLLSLGKIIDSRSFPLKEVEFSVPEEKLNAAEEALEIRVYDTVGNITSELLASGPGP